MHSTPSRPSPVRSHQHALAFVAALGLMALGTLLVWLSPFPLVNGVAFLGILCFGAGFVLAMHAVV